MVFLTTNGILDAMKYGSFEYRQSLPNGLPLEPNSQEPTLGYILFILKNKAIFILLEKIKSL